VTVEAAGEFVAVATKLLVPERRSGLVARPELIGTLEAGRARRATVVAAPTGFGKTSALTEWAAASPARFAWVSLDAGDDDPSRFWNYVVAAVETSAPELPGTAGRRLRGPGVSIADEVLPVLVNELTTLAQPLVLVLDDYHAIEDEEIHAGVQYMLERVGPDVHLVLAAWTVPPLRLGRLRARGELNECRADTLRFSETEVAALLNGAHDLKLGPDELAGLYRRTEGWVAGLNLVALSLRETGDRAAFLAGMPVDDRFLVDYLWDEVVARQPPGTRDFLMRTAVLERLSSELCDAVLERPDSAEMLLELERSNLFVIPLDADRRWFRYHTMFRAMLLRQLERFAPDRVPELHRRASAWFAARGDVHGTIEHAISAGDAHVAAETLRRSWLALYSDGKANEAIGWIDRLPPDTIAEYPDLALARGGVSRAMGRPMEEVEPWLARAEQAARDAADEHERAELTAGVARQRAMVRLGQCDVGEAVRLGRAAVAVRPQGSPEAPSDSYFLAVCLFWTGVGREAETRLREYLATVPPGEQDVRRVYAMALLAVAHAGRGEIEAAERLVEEALATTEARGQTEHPPTELVYVALGMVQLARGDVEAAEDWLEHAATLARRGADRIEIAHATVWLGQSRVRAGDVSGAADALDATRAALGGALVPQLVGLVDALDAEIRAAPTPVAPDPGTDGEPLGPEELSVLELLPSGLSYREIAERLGLPLDSVRTHGRRIRRRLGAVTRGEAVTAARRLNLI
jgi:LuxR family transcriptional regulator, maltose regulon positive regulatory protein